MTLENSRLDALPRPPRSKNAVETLGRLQTEFVSEVLSRAIADTSAAMAHQLSEPLTALLLYLHQLKQASERSGGTGSAPPEPMRKIVDMALRETERVCDIIERVGNAIDASADAEAAVMRGCNAIDAWAENSRVKGGAGASRAHPVANSTPLTPREHEVLALITGGSSNKEGGYRLGISTRTFEAHRAHLMGKLGARNAADLIRKALNQKQ